MAEAEVQLRPKATLITDANGFNTADVDATGALKVAATFSGTISGNAAAGPTGSPVPAAADYVGFEDNSGNLVGVSAANPLPVAASISFTDPAEGTPGVAAPVKALQVGGSDGTNLRTVATDASGQVKVLVQNAPSVAVSNFPATQPVSGTVTANVGSTNGLALDATVANPQTSPGTTAPAKIEVVAGKTSDVTPQYQPIPLTNAGAAVKTDGSATTQPVSGTVAVSNLPGTQPVSGTVAVSNFPATQPISAAALPLPTGAATDATVANTQSTAGTTTAPTKVQIVGGKTSDGTPQYQPVPLTNGGAAVKTDGSATTQPVSGTVGVNNFPATQPISAASLPLPTGAATDASLLNPQVTAGTTSAPTKVIVVAGKSSDATAQYQPVPLTAAGAAVKTDGSATTQPVSGTVSANAGTGNFNENIAQVNGSTVVTAATGVQKVGVVGNTGTALETTAGVLDQNIKNIANAAIVTAAAGVQKVGVVGGTGTSLETTAGVIDHNVKNINNVAVVAASAGVQKVGIAGGTGTSLETTAGVLDQNIKNINNAAVVTAATGVQKVGIVGNAGATVDSTVGAGTAPTNAVIAGVVFNAAAPAPTTGQAMASQADSAGSAYVNIEGRKATFGVGAAQFTPAATPTDFLVIQGSASKTVRIVRIILGAVATAAGQVPVSISRRSTANTGGTSAGLTPGKYDTNSAASTAVFTRYTANPTALGTSVAGLGTFSVACPLSGGNTILDFGSRPGGCIVLRGTADFIVLNGSGATLPTGTAFSITVEFTEE
jgi:hypothetical protein